MKVMMKDYLFDEDTYLEEVNCEWLIITSIFDADVEWIMHSDNSDDDGIEKVRRKKLKQIKKAKESEDNIVHKHFFFVGQKLLQLAMDKVKAITTDVGPKKKTIKGKGKQDDTPLGPNKKGISSGGRGRPKPLAPDECPWAVQITKVKNSETWENAFRAKAALNNQGFPPTSTVVIEEMPSSTPVAKPTKTKRLLLEYTPTVNVEDQVVANENANETVDGIMQELLSMNYEFDPFGCEQEETRVVTNEPEETLVEGETVLDGEEDSGTEEDESDDEDYLFDEDTYLEEVNVDMADYHFNIDADVEWIRHSESVQEPEYDVNPDDLDVIDNDNFESGTDSDDDGIEKVRRKKLKQIKKAKESEDNIVHKHFFFVGQTFTSADDVKERVRLHTRRQLYLAKNDKVRIRAKCFGRNPVFILDGEGPSTTDVGPKKKTIKGKGQLLTAIGLDANNGIYPLAYAIVEKETTDSWTWFLECVGDDLGMTKDSNFTFISDRQKGLAIAMANVFPCAEHAELMSSVINSHLGNDELKCFQP
ncbi:mutator type transposase [Tanacetum coccineum]